MSITKTADETLKENILLVTVIHLAANDPHLLSKIQSIIRDRLSHRNILEGEKSKIADIARKFNVQVPGDW